jgi:hypothetical protein
MTKESMKQQYDELESEISRLAELASRHRAFIGSQEFKELSDLEAALAVSQYHQLEAYGRTLMMRAALLGGRLSDPDGERPSGNDETPAPEIIVPKPGEFRMGGGIKVGGTVVSEG